MKKINTLCIIDDDHIFQFLAEKMAEGTDMVNHIEVFPNGLKAIDYFKSAQDSPDYLPDIIFLDLAMPVMDGWDFLDEYLKIKPQLKKEIKIYILSSSNDPSDMERARKFEEISEFVIKPVSKEKFVSLLKDL